MTPLTTWGGVNLQLGASQQPPDQPDPFLGRPYTLFDSLSHGCVFMVFFLRPKWMVTVATTHTRSQTYKLVTGCCPLPETSVDWKTRGTLYYPGGVSNPTSCPPTVPRPTLSQPNPWGGGVREEGWAGRGGGGLVAERTRGGHVPAAGGVHRVGGAGDGAGDPPHPRPRPRGRARGMNLVAPRHGPSPHKKTHPHVEAPGGGGVVGCLPGGPPGP